MKRLILALLACGAFTGSASAYNVSFDLRADQLRSTVSTTSFPTTGLCMLVASTTNSTFGPITAGTSLTLGSFLDKGDDQIIGLFDLTNTQTAGVLFVGPSVTTGGTFANLSAGDRLALYWFPTLTLTSTTIPNTATAFGTYQTGDVAPLNGSQAWTMPAATTNNYQLYFLTTDAVALGAGSHTAVEATAGFLTVPIPEPGTYSLLLAGSLVVFGVVLRRRYAA